MKRLLVAFLILAAACATPATGEERPPRIEMGLDICQRCGMIIEDERFASGYTREDGTAATFDDIGGMLDWAHFEDSLDRPMWVHDYDSLEWIKAADATFVRGGFDTPMGFSIAAFSSEEAARAFATDSGGAVIDWEDLLTLVRDEKLPWTPAHDHSAEPNEKPADDSNHDRQL